VSVCCKTGSVFDLVINALPEASPEGRFYFSAGFRRATGSGSLTFWLGHGGTVATQLLDLLITFSLYPEPLFNGVLRLVLFTVLPAGFVGYVPVRILQAPSVANVTTLVCVATAYVCVAVWVFERGLRRYTSGNRFTTFG
jgi:ABC-type uncharacterized transport system permease subunit